MTDNVPESARPAEVEADAEEIVDDEEEIVAYEKYFGVRLLRTVVTARGVVSPCPAPIVGAAAMTNPRRGRCLYECDDHHGVGPKVHTLECVLPSPMAERAYVCDNCRAEAVRQEIAADPYYSGDNYAMFGDDA